MAMEFLLVLLLPLLGRVNGPNQERKMALGRTCTGWYTQHCSLQNEIQRPFEREIVFVRFWNTHSPLEHIVCLDHSKMIWRKKQHALQKNDSIFEFDLLKENLCCCRTVFRFGIPVTFLRFVNVFCDFFLLCNSLVFINTMHKWHSCRHLHVSL